MANTLFDNEKELLKFYLKQNFLSSLKTAPHKNEGHARRNRIELIIRPQCNQQCEYCYIYKHGEELYPPETRVSNEELLENLKAFLYYVYIEQEFPIRTWELFAGDMFYDNLIFDILDIFYDYYKPFYEKYRDVLQEVCIVIPTNCSFATDDEKVTKWDLAMEKLATIGIVVHLSWSTDGLYQLNVREKKDLTQEHFDKIMEFAVKHECGIHPMISAAGIDTAIENYDWWLEFLHKQENYPEPFPSFLEVRNDDWTDEKIEKYIYLLKHMINKRLEMCDNSAEKLAYHLFNGDGKNGTIKSIGNYDVLQISTAQNNEDISCSIQDKLHVNLATLEIPLCHRLSYPQFIAGKFIKDENNKIIDVEPKNVSMFITIGQLNKRMIPNCQHCEIQNFCLGGCLGSQYESSGEIVLPNKTVCNLYKARLNFLFKAYHELGLFNIIFKDPEKYLRNDRSKIIILKDYLNRLGYKYE